MEKKVYDFVTPKDELVKVRGLEIMVKPYLSLDEQTELVNVYAETYFDSEKRNIPMDEYNVFGAESTLELAIIDLCSDITIKGAFENLYYDPEIYWAVREHIMNYDEFRELLDTTIENIKQQKLMKASVGATIDSIAEKFIGFISQLSKIIENLKPEDVDKMKQSASDLIKQLNETPLVKQVFEDSERGK